MILFHTALQAEANPLIEYFKLRYNSTFSKIKLYESDSIRLVISGTGKMKAASAVSVVLAYSTQTNVNFAINIGVVGAADHKRGSILRIHHIRDSATNRDYFPECEPCSKLNQAGLLCVDLPVSDPNVLSASYSLVDMESAGFFEACSLFLPQQGIELLKIVSDSLEPDSFSKREVEQHIISLIPQLEELIQFKSKNLAFKNKINDQETHDWILFCSEKLRLSVTQQRMVAQAVRYHQLTYTSPLPDKTRLEIPTTPAERSKRLEELLNRLYNE